MTNKDKMLQLVLSDSDLKEYYEIDISNIYTISDALNSCSPIVVAIAKIIKGINASDLSSKEKEMYKEVFGYLNKNII